MKRWLRLKCAGLADAVAYKAIRKVMVHEWHRAKSAPSGKVPRPSDGIMIKDGASGT